MKKFSRLGIFTLTFAISVLLILPAAQALDFKISGQVHRGVLWGDNGNDSDTKFVDVDNSSTRFRFTGSNTFNEVWKVGFKWENQMESNSTADTTIDIGNNGDSANVTFTERHMDIYVEHSMFGKVSLGQGDTASNGTSEVDLSGTDVAIYSSIEDMNGGFNFRDDDNTVITSIGAAYSNFDGFSRRDRVRYDTPKFGPIFLSTSYTNGQSWDVAGRLAYEWDGIGKLAAAGHWTGADTQRDPYKQYSGSASFLHSSGFNITVSGGGRYDVSGRNEDPYNLYGKLGYKFGKWALAVDYTYSENVGADDDEATSVGATAVWNVWESVQFYTAYRWNDLDRDDAQRAPGVGNAESINSVLVGARVKF